MLTRWEKIRKGERRTYICITMGGKTWIGGATNNVKRLGILCDCINFVET